MSAGKTAVIECDLCGAVFTPITNTMSIKEVRDEAKDDGWAILKGDIDHCPDCKE